MISLPCYSLPVLAKSLYVSKFTVRRWVKDGLINPRVHLESGRTIRYLFTADEVSRFLDANFPTRSEVLSEGFQPKSKKAERIVKLVNMQNIYSKARKDAKHRPNPSESYAANKARRAAGSNPSPFGDAQGAMSKDQGTSPKDQGAKDADQSTSIDDQGAKPKE